MQDIISEKTTRLLLFIGVGLGTTFAFFSATAAIMGG